MMAESHGYKVILGITFLALLSVGDGLASPKLTPVEVWSGGDDGLTMKLRDTVENGFKSSSAIHLSTGKQPGTLVVTIPSNVKWERVGNRTRVVYTVAFTSVGNQHLGSSAGACWENELSKCASKIVSDA